MKLNFLNKYLSPSQQGRVYVAVAVVGIFIAAIVVMTILEPERVKPKPKPVVENIITDRNSRQFGLDAVNDKLVIQKRQMEEYEDEMEVLRRKNQDLEKKVKQANQLNNDVKNAQRTVAQLNKQLEALKKDQVEMKNKQLTYSDDLKAAQQTQGSIQHPELKVNPERRKVNNPTFSYGPDSSSSNTSVTGNNTVTQAQGFQFGPEQSAVADTRSASLFTVIENPKPQRKEASKEIYLPKGSILTGVLITGLDAPTSASAVEQPVPVLVRIKKEAILPNYAVVDEVNECFAIMAGYGDLSSERAMLRGESLSCVKKDGSVIEADFRSFSVGEDGKNGLKGTLVTRNSKVLANSMMAGFAAGMASMFDVNPVPVISTSSTGSTQYQDVFSAEALQGGAAQGASDAMNRLADYYMELADAMHPVIEIGAGRVVDMVVTSGTGL